MLPGIQGLDVCRIIKSDQETKNTPIIIGHGIQDQVVKLKSSELAYSYLKKYGANVKLITYSGNHKIGIQFLRRIRQFIESTIESN